MLIYDEYDNIREADIRMIYNLSANELRDKIQDRWLQPWNMIDMNGEIIQRFCYHKPQCDDIGVTRFVMKPKL
jgi:hypothetical protein